MLRENLTLVIWEQPILRGLWAKIIKWGKPKTKLLQTQSDWASLKRLILRGSDACYLWRLCFFQTVRRHGLEHPTGIVDRRVTKFVKVRKSPEDLPRVIGRGLCDFSSRRIRWGLCVRDWVSSSLNTQPLQPDVQLRQQLELVYQIIVFTKPTGSISSTLSFHHYCVVCGSISSTLSFPHYCVVCLFIYVFEDFH